MIQAKKILFWQAEKGSPGQAGEPELSDWRGKPAYQDGLITR